MEHSDTRVLESMALDHVAVDPMETPHIFDASPQVLRDLQQRLNQRSTQEQPNPRVLTKSGRQRLRSLGYYL